MISDAAPTTKPCQKVQSLTRSSWDQHYLQDIEDNRVHVDVRQDEIEALDVAEDEVVAVAVAAWESFIIAMSLLVQKQVTS